MQASQGKNQIVCEQLQLIGETKSYHRKQYHSQYYTVTSDGRTD